MTTETTSDTPDGLALWSSNVRSPSGGADVKRKHHKPPYKCSDPFRYRTLTYVQLSLNLSRFSFAVVRKPIAAGNMSTIVPLRIGGRHMRFVLVNGRTPRPQTFCVLCCEPIGSSYLREIGTGLPYCDHDCYADHCRSAIHVLENHARAS
jgi:hypothetical protein